MNSKKDTAEAEKILSFLGKPTTTTSYSVKTNPAIIKLMKYLNGDIAQVCRWTDTLKKLGWVEPDMTEREMEKQLTKYASFVDKKVSQMSREEMLTPPQVAKRGRPRKDAEEKPKKSKKAPKERIDPELVESAVDTQDIGMVAMMQKEITHLRKKYTDSQIMEYEHRRLVKELSAELEAAKPDKFELKVTPSQRIVKGKFYNILPLSDIHWGEVVKPQEVNNANAYNTDISRRRHIDLFQKNYEYASQFGCDELHIFMLGDMFSGNIHDELRESNEMGITKCIVKYYEFLTGLIESYSKLYKKIYIDCVVGNHARTTMKFQFKEKGISNYEYILYAFLQDHFKDSANIKVNFGDSPVLFTTVGEQRWKIEHGDRFKGGSAFVSPLSTVIRDNFKDQAIFGATGQNFDATIMGHWHIGGLWYLPGTVSPVYFNPSMIGPNEYALNNLHGGFPASSYSFITDGKQVVDLRLFDFSAIR